MMAISTDEIRIGGQPEQIISSQFGSQSITQFHPFTTATIPANCLLHLTVHPSHLFLPPSAKNRFFAAILLKGPSSGNMSYETSCPAERRPERKTPLYIALTFKTC